MTLGAWIFLSVVLVLVVFNKPFRKFFLWTAAVSAVCGGLFFGYVWMRDWQERREKAREVAIQQKKQDDCNARLNVGLKTEGLTDAFERLANADLCRANPDITVDAAIAAQHPKNPQSTAPDTLPADFFEKQPQSQQGPKSARQPVRPKAIEGTVTKDAVVYGESLPGGPGGKVLGKVESSTHVRVIQLDSIYGNVQIKTPSGITGWLSSDEVNY